MFSLFAFPITIAPGGVAPGGNDSSSTYIMLGLLGALLLFVVGVAIRNQVSGGVNKAGFNLRKACKIYGLGSDQRKILKSAIKKQKLSNPASLFNSSRYLNACLRKIMDEIDRSNFSQNQKEYMKSGLFDIKQKISMHSSDMDKKMTTRSLPSKQAAQIFSKTFPPFNSEIVGKTNDWVVMELPKDSHGDWVHYKEGETVKIKYLREQGKVYTFVSKISGTRELEGEMRLLLEHADTVKRVQLRQSPRREFHRSAFFYKVDIVSEGSGRKATRRAVVNKNRKYTGSLLDISAGGCALLSRSPLAKSEIIMISFDISPGTTVSVFGKIRNLKRDRNGTIMNIAFTKVSTKTLNDIRSLVFGFEDDLNSNSRYNIS